MNLIVNYALHHVLVRQIADILGFIICDFNNIWNILILESFLKMLLRLSQTLRIQIYFSWWGNNAHSALFIYIFWIYLIYN